MTRDPSQDEPNELALRILAGDVDFDSEEARRLAQENPALWEEVREMRGLCEELDTCATQDHDLIEKARRTVPSTADREHVSRFVRRMSRRNPFRSLWPLVLAAAAILLVVWVIQPRERPDDQPVEILNTSGAACLTPKNEVVSFVSFTWSGELPPGGQWIVRVDSETEIARDGPLLDVEATQNQWQPNETQLLRLPDRIRWTLLLETANGERAVMDSTVAWLRSP